MTSETTNETTNEKKNRYYIKDGSDSCHCCFAYSVMDSDKIDDHSEFMIKMGGMDRSDASHVCVCECQTRGDAEKICNALNDYKEKPKVKKMF